MAKVSVHHHFTSAKADGADLTKIQPSYWNAEEDFSGAETGALVVRDETSDTGASYVSAGASGYALVSGGVGAIPVYSDLGLLYTPLTRTINGHPLSANISITASDVGLGNVENTALSTWTGTANIATVGTITSGVWTGTVIADAKIAATIQRTTGSPAGFVISSQAIGDILYANSTTTWAKLPVGSNGNILTLALGIPSWASAATVTSVGLALPSFITVSGSPVTSSGTLTGTLTTQVMNTVFSGPASGADAAPTFRILVNADIPSTLTGKTYNGLTLTAAATGFTVAGGTTSKTLTVSLDASVSGTNTGDQDLSSYATTAAVSAGYVPLSRTVNGHALSGDISVSASDVGLGSVENTALSTWAGTANITTLGTIGTGTWNATAIADGKIASALTGKTYNGLTVTSSTGTLTIAAAKTLTVSNILTFTGTDSSSVAFGAGGTVLYTAVTSATGTANQVTVSASTGAVTFSLPQDIATSSAPQFARLGLGGAAHASIPFSVTAGNDVQAVSITGGSITGSGTTKLLAGTQTWNTSGNVIGVSYAFTETAKGATSRYLQILGGVSATTDEFYVQTGGTAFIATRLGIGAINASYLLSIGVTGTSYTATNLVLVGTNAPGMTWLHDSSDSYQVAVNYDSTNDWLLRNNTRGVTLLQFTGGSSGRTMKPNVPITIVGAGSMHLLWATHGAGDIGASGATSPDTVWAKTKFGVGSSAGVASATFTSLDGKTVTVTGGIVSAVV